MTWQEAITVLLALFCAPVFLVFIGWGIYCFCFSVDPFTGYDK